MTTVIKSCPMCGGMEAIYLGDLGSVSYLRCRRCGMTYAHDGIDEQEEGNAQAV